MSNRGRGETTGWLLVAAALLLTMWLLISAVGMAAQQMITVCTDDPAMVSGSTPLCLVD